MFEWKLGNRCKRCHEMVNCLSCEKRHPVNVEVPPHTVVDHTTELCIDCCTPEEMEHSIYHMRRRAEGALIN